MAAVSPLPLKTDRQPRSKDVTSIADRQLPLVEKGDAIAVDPALVHRQRTMLAVVALCMQAAGIADKEACIALGLDPGHWSRITAGNAHFPLSLLGPLMDLCGNEAPLEWLAHSRGYELRPLQTETERRLADAEVRAAKAEERAALLAELLVGRGRP
jgi:hypothetical protein